MDDNPIQAKILKKMHQPYQRLIFLDLFHYLTVTLPFFTAFLLPNNWQKHTLLGRWLTLKNDAACQ
jgi:hypothetical protein